MAIQVLRQIWTCLLLLWGISAAAFPQQFGRYHCMSDHFALKEYKRQYSRKLDPQGVIMQKSAYHPVTISFFGIMSYDSWLETGDSAHYRNCVNQFNYFSNASLLHFTDDSLGIGLPYHEDFHDLKAPWYSGMAQGAALSYLARYHHLTGDEDALPLMQRLAHFMLRPEEKGGTLGRTPEGYLWIEEYPNSETAPQVLNGFINGLLGLHDYLETFPGDTLARRVHAECLAAMKATLPAYDTPFWTSYDRRMNSCSNQYMRYEIQEMDHLFRLYGDSLLLRQMMLWSRQAFGRQDWDGRMYIRPRYFFSHPMAWDSLQGVFFTQTDWRASLRPLKGVTTTSKDGGTRPLNPLMTFHPGRKELSLPQEHHCVIFRLPGADSTAVDFIGAQGSDGRPAKAHAIWRDSLLEVKSSAPFGKVALRVRQHLPSVQIMGTLPNDYLQPRFLHVNVDSIYRLEGQRRYQVHFETENVSGAIVYYRTAGLESNIPYAKWRHDQVLQPGSSVLVPPAAAHYEFFVIFPYVMPDPRLSAFSVVPLP